MYKDLVSNSVAIVNDLKVLKERESREITKAFCNDVSEILSRQIIMY